MEKAQEFAAWVGMSSYGLGWAGLGQDGKYAARPFTLPPLT